MDQIRNTQRALDGALSMIESASPASLSKPTPCRDWDAHALIEHMIGVVRVQRRVQRCPTDPSDRSEHHRADRRSTRPPATSRPPTR